MPLSEQAKENAKNYRLNYAKKTYKRVPLDMRIEEYDELKNYCDNKNIPVQTFIKQAIKDKMSE